MKKENDNAAAAIRERRDVDDAFKWRTEDIFPSDEAWEEAFEVLRGNLPRVASFKGRLKESAKTLLDCFMLQDEITVKLEQAFAYASLNKDVDTRVTEYQDGYNRIYALVVEFSEAASYITPEILSIPEERIKSFLKEEEGLMVYGHALDNILRQREHVLSEKEEAIIAAAGNVFRAPSDAFNMLTDADMSFPKIKDEKGDEMEVSNALYYLHRNSRHRAVRRANEEAFHGTYRKFRNTLASLLRSSVYKSIFEARVRGYPSTLHAALDSPNIPVEVYHNLLQSVHDNIEPLHRYTGLRKRILGLDEIYAYDLYNTLYPDADMKVDFDEAKTLLAEGLKPLGEEYVDIMMNGLEGGWVDVYENTGKRSGAYSAGIYGVHPFVLLNYHDRLDDAFTVAHELGHSMHSYYSQKTQPKVYADYTIFNAEVASTTNEVLLMNHLLQVTKEKDKRRFLLDFYLDSIRATFFRQTLFAEFELEIHERAEKGESITADFMDELYGSLMQKYYGPELKTDAYMSTEWCRIPHFYRCYYVYSYATGYAAAVAFSQRILAQGRDARAMYLSHFLSGGSSDYSTEILKKAGVDMTSPEPIVATARLFDSLLDELEKLAD